MPNHPEIKDIRFGEHDLLFLADQAEKRNMFAVFAALLGVGSLIGLVPLGHLNQPVKDAGKMLIDHLAGANISVRTPGWTDAIEPLKRIVLSVAIRDLQAFLAGGYVVDDESGETRLKAPTGKSLRFFMALLGYYVCVND